MQCPKNTLEKTVHERMFEPLGFLSAQFRGSFLNWSMPEKEGFAILEAMTLFEYIIMGRLIYTHNDHHNLLTMYYPQDVSSSIRQFTMNKLLKWAIKLSAFRYVVEYIKGNITTGRICYCDGAIGIAQGSRRPSVM